MNNFTDSDYSPESVSLRGLLNKSQEINTNLSSVMFSQCIQCYRSSLLIGLYGALQDISQPQRV